MKLVPPTVQAGKQFDLFDEAPIQLKACRLLARRAEILGRPSLPDWTSDFLFVHATNESAPFWIGDLWNHTDDRPDWHELLPQALADIGLDFQAESFRKFGYVARNVGDRARAAAQSFSHAMVVADLKDESDQVELLEESKREHWGHRDLMKAKRRRSRAPIVDGQEELDGLFRVIYADPPWSYNDSGVITDNDAYGRAERHYPSMKIEELCALPVAAHAMPNAVLFLWTTAPMILTKPGPIEVINAWGFKPKTGMVWDKVLHNFGHYVSVRHEHLLICTRGSCTPDRITPMVDSVQTIRRSDVHSQKPEEFRRIIEQLYTKGPYLEIFGRKPVRGWKVFGNDARLWPQEAAS